MPTLLLTRPRDASLRFAALVRDRLGDIDTRIAPLIGIEICATPPIVAADESYVLTSEHAVAALVRHGLPLRRAWAVGDRTAAAAAAAGLPVRSAAGDAAALVAAITAARDPGPLLHLHGEHTRGDVAARLCAAGVPTRAAVVYRQPAGRLPDGLGHAGRAVVAPVFSPRTGDILSRQWAGPAPLLVAAMSPAVAAALAGLRPAALTVAAAPDARAMADTVVLLWQQAQKLEARAGGA